MKQCITQEQYEELSDKARMKFIEWTLSRGDHAVTYRSIGHLMWFLDEHLLSGWWQLRRDSGKTEWMIASKYGPGHDETFPELIDALWDAVKMVLEEENEEE